MAAELLTFTGQAGVLLGALLGAGGGLRYMVEPVLQRRRLRKVVATGLWLSCHELRDHFEAIRSALSAEGPRHNETRDALLKIPRYDAPKDRVDWYVKHGYFTMVTAYKIAAFSCWMRIYQATMLKAVYISWSNRYSSTLFEKFDAFKIAASRNTVLWYTYIDAIGDKLISRKDDLDQPLNFSSFCENYYANKDFLYFFDQLHMFIHFMGRKETQYTSLYGTALPDMIDALSGLESFIVENNQILLSRFKPQDRERTISLEQYQDSRQDAVQQA